MLCVRLLAAKGATITFPVVQERPWRWSHLCFRSRDAVWGRGLGARFLVLSLQRVSSLEC